MIRGRLSLLLRRPLFWCGVLLLLQALLVFWKLGGGSIGHVDEFFLSERSREVLLVPSPWITHLYFTPDERKPPLQFWLTALNLKLFDDPELAVRLWPALFSLGLSAMILLSCRELKGTWDWAAPVSLLLFLCYPATLQASRAAWFSTGTLFFIMAVFFCCLKGGRNSRWFIIAGIMAGIGAWQKNALPLLVLGLWPFASLDKKAALATMRDPSWRWGAATGLVIFLAWPVLCIAHGLGDWGRLVLNTNRAPSDIPIRFENYRAILHDWAVPAILGMAASILFIRREASTLRTLGFFTLLTMILVLASPLNSFRYVFYVVPFLALSLGVCLSILRPPFLLPAGILLATATAFYAANIPSRTLVYFDGSSAFKQVARAAAPKIAPEESVVVLGKYPPNAMTWRNSLVLFYGNLPRPVTFVESPAELNGLLQGKPAWIFCDREACVELKRLFPKGKIAAAKSKAACYRIPGTR